MNVAGDISDRNVFILGAGFSAAAGAPLIHNFLDCSREFRDDPDSRLDPEERALFDEVFKFKKRVAQSREKFRIDLDTIEQLFGLVEMSHRLNRASESTRNATVYLIAKTLQLAIEKNTQRPRITFSLAAGHAANCESFLGKVARAGSGADTFATDIYTHFALLLAGNYDDPHKRRFRTNTVISFNYDIIFDHALMEIGSQPIYGLQREHLTAEMPSNGVSLLKLHGSTNWGICSQCETVAILREKVTVFPSEFRSRRCGKCSQASLRPFLVPPSWDKSDHQDVMRPVWQKAVEALQSATRICVIGYSMPETDAFFKFLLALGLAENDRLYKFVLVDKVVNPLLSPGLDNNRQFGGSGDVEQRYRTMLEGLFVERRFQFYGSGFANFLTQGNQILNRAEMIYPTGIY